MAELILQSKHGKSLKQPDKLLVNSASISWAESRRLSMKHVFRFMYAQRYNPKFACDLHIYME